METLQTAKEIMHYISTMNRENSVCQFHIPGKGKFTLVLQEEDQVTIGEEVEKNPELKEMIEESKEQYKQGLGMTTSELIKSLSSKDFK